MEVDETDIPNVKIGQKAEVTIDAWPNQSFSGTVTEVGSSPRDRSLGSSTDAVNFEVKIQLDNPPPQVRPGFSCSAEITTASRAGVVTVPIQAVVIREKEGAKKGADSEEEGVYLFDGKEQKVKFQPVKTGISGETSVEVLTGVTAGQEIVTGPFKALRDISDGAKVKLQEEKGKGKGGPAEKKDA
jgi:HlyD family secretion protein